MATRDRSQGITFIYENPLKLLRTFEAQSGNAVSFKTQRPDVLPMGVLEAEESKRKDLDGAIARLKGNLEKLQNMHSKISFMISELEKGTSKK